MHRRKPPIALACRRLRTRFCARRAQPTVFVIAVAGGRYKLRRRFPSDAFEREMLRSRIAGIGVDPRD
ncbi:hypothetical protein J2Z19_005687 [Ensifer adhaerens]|uniref:Uncharacterized protein n=1 Tax=Ensifer adhaerens TaxID=106592 RepID=A0ACC5T5K7_ENSAD|nr:hypothetical protein [Ensifer adhaerens]